MTYSHTKVYSRTRGQEVTAPKEQCRLDIRNVSFSQRTVNEWNRLSFDCVMLVVLKDKKRLRFRVIHLIEFIQSNNFNIYLIF